MALRHIKWNENQQKRLATSVRKFNAKITRELKTNPNLAPYLPKKLSTKELRQTLKTAKDLDQLVRSVDRAFKPNAFAPVTTSEGVTTTDWQVRELKLQVRRINRERARQLEKLDLSPQTGTMGNINKANLKPKKFDLESIKPTEWDLFVASAEKQSRDSYRETTWAQYKDNYLSACEEYLGDYGSEIYNFVSAMPAEAVGAGMDNYFLTIPFLYSKYDQEAKAKVIYENWVRHYDKWKAENKSTYNSWERYRRQKEMAKEKSKK